MKKDISFFNSKLFTLINCEDFIFQIDVVSRLKYIRKKVFGSKKNLGSINKDKEGKTIGILKK